jgi:S1-C subfamily serine protease
MDDERDDFSSPADDRPDLLRLGPEEPACMEEARRLRGAARRATALIAVAVVAAGLALGLVAGGRLLGALASESSGLPGGLELLQGPSPPGGVRTGVDQALRGIVNINTSFSLADTQGAATGMVITPDGLVLTNNHVINGATQIQATSAATGRTYAATVVGYDRRHDIAVLQLDGVDLLETVPLGSSHGLRPGDRVTALGNARGLGGTPKAAPGVITALDRTIVAEEAGGARAERLTGMIQTDARIVGGDSGGPLVGADGRVVGMTTANSVGSGSRHGPVIGFAIPIDDALSVARRIMAGEATGGIHIGPTAFLGVAVAPDPGVPDAVPGLSPSGGAAVGGLVPGYPAEGTGIGRGDVIVSLGGQPVTSASSLMDVLGRFRPGDLVRLEWRDTSGAPHSASVTLAEGPPA